MIAMESRDYEREAEEDLAWMISSPTFLVEDCLGLWVDRAEGETQARGEEMIWFTR